MKLKYLSVLLLSSLVLPICSYVSANNVDGFVSENEITSCDYNPIMSEGLDNFYAVGVKDNYFCLLMSPTGLIPQVSQKWYSGGDYEDKSYVCSTYKSTDDNVAIYVNHDPDNKILGCYKSSSLITFDSSTIGPQDEVLGSFKTTLQGLVSDFADGFYAYLPLVILLGIWVFIVFTFWFYIKHASSELFTLNRKGNKSLSRFQNEDLVNMYSDWKNDFIEKKSTSIFNNTYKLSNGKVVDDSADNVYRKANGDVMMGYGNENTTEEEYYYAFMYREYEARIPRYQARKFRESDRAEGISYRDSVYRAYNDMKQSS